MSPLHDLVLVVAGLAAGAISAMAGGASLLSFPVLIGLGLPPLTANVTNNVGLVPASGGAALASRLELRGQRSAVGAMVAPMVLGALAGAAALLLAPAAVFGVLVPFLVAGASVMLFAQPRLVARTGGRNPVSSSSAGRWASAFGIGAYTAYFGAAASLLFLALIGLFSVESIHRLNALKNISVGLAATVAMVVFALLAPVDWPAAAALALGSIGGGAAGVRIARRVPAERLRNVVAVAGLGMAVWFAITGV